MINTSSDAVLDSRLALQPARAGDAPLGHAPWHRREGPLTLAIVSDETGVPKALEAGANSILPKPIQIPQITDTLTTARGLLRAKESAPQANPGSPAIPAVNGTEKTLRSGEFLQS